MKQKEQALKELKELEDSFNKKVIELKRIIEQPESLYDKIKNFSDVCKELNETELTIQNFYFLPTEQRFKAYKAYQLQTIAKLFNQDWKPNWSNSKEYKYYPYWEYNNKLGGWVFCFVHVCSVHSLAVVAYYRKKEDCEFVSKVFKDIYSDYLNN